jgi:hypothetical protein
VVPQPRKDGLQPGFPLAGRRPQRTNGASHSALVRDGSKSAAQHENGHAMTTWRMSSEKAPPPTDPVFSGAE